MKNLLLKLIVLKITQILILSQLVFAQNSFEDSFNNDDAQSSEANSDGFNIEGGFDDERFSGELRVNDEGFRIEFRTHDKGTGFRQEFRDHDGRYEFRERVMDNAPNFGPSYEGYDKEMMLFGRLFHHIEGEIDPEQIKQYCSNLDEMADIVISKVKAKTGEISNVCNDLAEEEAKCKERNSEHCSMMGKPDTSYAIDDLHKQEILSSSCPVNSDAIKEACILRLKEHMEDRMQNVEENCEYQWESYGKQNQENCERTQEDIICDEDDYIENCLDRFGVKEEDFEKKCPYFPPAGYQKPYCENGFLKDVYNTNNCLVGYECILVDKPQIATCPYTEEQAREKESACLASNGKPETIRDGNCIVDIKCHTDTAVGDNIAGNAVGAFNSYDDYKRQCYNEWQYQKQNCEQIQRQCGGEDAFIKDCVAREKGYVEKDLSNVKRQCEIDSRFQIRNMERQCAMMNAERQRCLDESSKRCEMSQGLANECREKVTEENFRNFIIREAEKRCKFMPYMEKKDFSKYNEMEVVLAVVDTVGEEEISKIEAIVENLNKKYEADGKIIFEGMIKPSDFNKLKELSFIVGAKLSAPESSETAKARKGSIIANLNPEKVIEKLLELSGSDVSSEYKYLIEGEANDILEASESIDDVQESEESKGFGYKIKLFLGLAKEIEESEVKNLEMSKQRLETSIKSLGALSEEMPNEISKAILKEQVAELERQKEDLESLIKQKQKKAKGLLRLFGLFG